jgi:hypothetical protein
MLLILIYFIKNLIPSFVSMATVSRLTQQDAKETHKLATGTYVQESCII